VLLIHFQHYTTITIHLYFLGILKESEISYLDDQDSQQDQVVYATNTIF